MTLKIKKQITELTWISIKVNRIENKCTWPLKFIKLLSLGSYNNNSGSPSQPTTIKRKK